MAPLDDWHAQFGGLAGAMGSAVGGPMPADATEQGGWNGPPGGTGSWTPGPGYGAAPPAYGMPGPGGWTAAIGGLAGAMGGPGSMQTPGAGMGGVPSPTDPSLASAVYYGGIAPGVRRLGFGEGPSYQQAGAPGSGVGGYTPLSALGGGTPMNVYGPTGYAGPGTAPGASGVGAVGGALGGVFGGGTGNAVQAAWNGMARSGGGTPMNVYGATGYAGPGQANGLPMQPAPGGGLVLLRAPNGQTQQVPAAQVAHYLAHGAQRV